MSTDAASRHADQARTRTLGGRRRALVVLALISPALWLLTQVRWLPQDTGGLLQVGSQTLDVVGTLQGAWQRATRDCRTVSRWPEGSVTWVQAREVLAGHSPPASSGARPLQVLSMQQTGGQALLVEVVWDASPASAPLNPAIVPMRLIEGRWEVLQPGVWSGDTGPWQTTVFIRRWLQRQGPDLPASLVECLDPQEDLFRP